VNEPKLPAWQDVLGDAEQVVRQKPIFAKYIKGTILEKDVPVWMATFAQQAVMRDRARRLQDFSAAPSHDYGAGARYVRKPEADKRVSRGDDFAGDAWIDATTGETVYTVVGFDRNQRPTMIVQDGRAVPAGVDLPDGAQR
jgi:hypothetical protein